MSDENQRMFFEINVSKTLKYHTPPEGDEARGREEKEMEANDWFNTARYERKVYLPLLSRIQLPTVVVDSRPDPNARSEKDLARIYSSQSIPFRAIAAGISFTDRAKAGLQAGQLKAYQISADSSQIFDGTEGAKVFSKPDLRAKVFSLAAKTTKAEVAAVSKFRDLDEGYFKSKTGLHFAHLHLEFKRNFDKSFVQKPESEDVISILVHSYGRKAQGIISFLLRHLSMEDASSHGNLCLLTALTEGGELEMTEDLLTADTQSKTDFLESIVPLEVSPEQPTSSVASQMETEAKEFAEAGVMLYIGESKLPKWEANVTKEIRYKRALAKHAAVGLGCLQHRGVMILRLYETETSFTTQLMFLLYSLFESILLVKPFSGSPVNSGQYLICNSLKDLNQAKAIQALLLKKQESVSEGELDLGELFDPSIIEEEDRFRQSLANQNLAVLDSRKEILQLSVLNKGSKEQLGKQLREAFEKGQAGLPEIVGNFGVCDFKAFRFKRETLTEFGVPVQSSEPTYSAVERLQKYLGRTRGERPAFKSIKEVRAIAGKTDEEIQKGIDIAKALFDEDDQKEKAREQRRAKIREEKARQKEEAKRKEEAELQAQRQQALKDKLLEEDRLKREKIEKAKAREEKRKEPKEVGKKRERPTSDSRQEPPKKKQKRAAKEVEEEEEVSASVEEASASMEDEESLSKPSEISEEVQKPEPEVVPQVKIMASVLSKYKKQ